MVKIIVYIIIFCTTAVAMTVPVHAEPAYNKNLLDLPVNLQQRPIVRLLADCYDDCLIKTQPTESGEVAIAIVKGNNVVDSALMPVDPGLTGSPEHMPPGGTGAISMSTESRAIDGRGRIGTVIAKDTWTYVNYLLRSVSVKREFIPDEMYASGG